MSRNLIIGLAVASIVLVLGCSDSSDSRSPAPVAPAPAEPTEAVGFSATVHRTEAGFPHIIAEDFDGLGFGTGYANAEDNFCILALNVLRQRGQLAEYLGPDDGNLNSDLFKRYLIETGIYDAPVTPELQHAYAGFAAGFNRYLRDTGIDNIPDAQCRGASWIKQMSAEDVKRAELTPVFLPRLATLFIAAAPPTSVAATEEAAELSDDAREQVVATINNIATARDKGSNGVGIGRELTDHNGAILYTNPHVDSDLTFQFFPRHQIIPGVTNLLGATTYERVMVGFGTNGDVAWTNTVTPARTLALYELELVPGNPVAYRFDGEEREFEQTEVSIMVKDEEGNLGEQSHTFYESHQGLVMGLLFSWTDEKAFVMRVADEGNRGQNGQNIALARSKTVHDIVAASNAFQASSNTTTIAADKNGDVMYGDYGPIANLSDQQLEDCVTDTPVLIAFFAPAFSGNTSACEWNTDSDSAAPGLLGASQHPSIVRSDYVTNSNDSYWLTNPNAPLTGFPKVMGDIEDERTLRTRSGLRMIQERIDGVDGLGGTTFNIDSTIELMLSNQHLVGQLLRDDLVTLCEDNPNVDLDGEMVDISAACPILAGWDLRANLDSRGAHLFREFLRAASGGSLGSRTLPASLNYTVPFDIADPINTPRGLDTSDNPVALSALAQAVNLLTDAGIALDARLGDLQSMTRNDTRIPMHGGSEAEGVFNKMALAFAGSEGYPAVTDSSGSWIMAVEFLESGVVAKGIYTYSMSTSSESPRYSEMTEMFSRKELVDLPYTLEEVEAAALSTLELSEGTENCADGGWEGYQQPIFSDEDACREFFIDVEANQLLDFVDE